MFDTKQQNSICFNDSKYKNRMTQERTIQSLQEEVLELKNEILRFKKEDSKENDPYYNVFFKESTIVKLIIDPFTGLIIKANDAAISFYGYTRLEITQMNINQINTLSAIQLKDKRLDTLHGNKTHYIFKHQLKNGEIKDVEVYSGKITLDLKPLLFSTILDITERKKVAATLKKSETQLRDLNATKDKMFSIIAHDLRTPFIGILGLSDLLLKNLNNYPIQKSKKILKTMSSSSQNTLALLDNLLNWAKSQTGKFSFTPESLNLNTVISETINMLRSSAQFKNITLEITHTQIYRVNADKNMLKIILYNLISNAIKFSYLDQKIDLSIEAKPNWVQVNVVDYGVGMDQNQVSSLFQSNTHQSTEGTANEKGTGLGLVLCKEFVDRHKGKIGVESSKSQGSRFFFYLPL